jgi:hypothetical protein
MCVEMLHEAHFFEKAKYKMRKAGTNLIPIVIPIRSFGCVLTCFQSLKIEFAPILVHGEPPCGFLLGIFLPPQG